MANNRDLLNSAKTKLRLFEDHIALDKNLPKWQKAEKRLQVEKDGRVKAAPMPTSSRRNDVLTVEMGTNDVDAALNNVTYEPYELPEQVSFDDVAKAGIEDLNRILAEDKIKYVMAGFGSFGSTSFNGRYISDTDTISLSEYSYDMPIPNNLGYANNGTREEPTAFNKFIKRLMYRKVEPKKKEEEKKYVFDALTFFSLVKTTSKESQNTYRDRVSGYLAALHNAQTIGQVALMEQLLREMITNKYESVLFSEGFYYVIKEEQMVDFIKKCEKGLALDYIKNFSRPIPQHVVDIINKVNSFEIFDNYVVLNYDPQNSAYKETAKEEAKRRDPIIFGVIAGSNKLYYIADWEDEYCNLTLEKFVETAHLDKEKLKIDEVIK